MVNAILQEDRVVRRGRYGEYHWLTASGDIYIGTLLRLCPAAVLHHFLAVTSYDSGCLRLTSGQIAEGWSSEGGVAYSPIVTSITPLRYQDDGPEYVGYDEWYVFPEHPKLEPIYLGNYFEFDPDAGQVMVFASHPAFVLHDPAPYVDDILERFWKQLVSIAPETFIADGVCCLTVVSRNEALIADFGEGIGALAPAERELEKLL